MAILVFGDEDHLPVCPVSSMWAKVGDKAPRALAQGFLPKLLSGTSGHLPAQGDDALGPGTAGKSS